MEKKIDRRIISIIVPVYNVKDQLERCLESILGQTYNDFECILIDDGSIDGSGEICDTYSQKDDRLIVIHQKNAGLSVARNNGMKIAKGTYLSFIDSDDYVLPTYLEKMVDLLENTDSDIVKCDYYKGVYENNCTEPHVEMFTGKEFTELLLTDQIGSQLWQYLFKKELWDGIVSPVGRFAQDMMILHEVTDKARKVVVTSEKLYYYYIDRTNSTSNASSNKVKGAFDRAIAFKMRYEFAVERKYKDCRNQIIINVLAFFNNAETLKNGNNARKFIQDESELMAFLKSNKKARSIKRIGFKYSVLGACLAHYPNIYSKIRGKK